MKYGTPGAVELLSEYLFLASQSKELLISKMSAPFPANAMSKAMAGGKVYTSNHYPIVECLDLKAKAGSEIKFNLRGPVYGTPAKGDENFEGTGKRLPWSNASLKLGFSAFPVYAGSLTDQQVTQEDLYTNAQDAAITWAQGFTNEASIVHLYGDRGYETKKNWSVPMAGATDLSRYLDNAVKPPSRNRHYRADGDTIVDITNTAGVLDFATTDIMTLRTVEKIITENNESTYPIMGCKFDGDDLGAEEPVSVLLVSERQYDHIVATGGNQIQTLMSNALARASRPGQSDVFKRPSLFWKGCLITIQPRQIRFYPGNSMKYCSSLISEATTTATVPTGAGWDNTRAIDRAIFLGSMALGKVIGGHNASKFGIHKTLAGFMWSEKWLNHDTKLEVAAMMLQSFGKFRFDLDWGGTVQPTDYGVMAIDSVVEVKS